MYSNIRHRVFIKSYETLIIIHNNERQHVSQSVAMGVCAELVEISGTDEEIES